jgi:hypothetical protein
MGALQSFRGTLGRLVMEYASKIRGTQLQTVLPASIFVFVLALAVFGWGLHSKLSLYRVSAQTSAQAPVAKLLSQRERPTNRLEQVAVAPADLHMVVFVASVLLTPRSIESKPLRRDRSAPPRQWIPLQGPSLLRPPPSLG